MADAYIQIPIDSSGKKVDADGLTVAGQTVYRQRVVIADPTTDVGLGRVKATQPAVSDPGLVVRPITRGATATVARIADTATSTTLAAANVNRLSLTIVNDSSAMLYVLKGSGTASSTNYTYLVQQYDTVTIDDYVGQVTGVWATDPNDGGAQVTEVTP